MYAGQIVEAGTIEQVHDRPAHPYSDALLASYPGLAVPGRPLPTIAGQVPQPGSWPAGCHFAPRCRFAGDECRSGDVPLIPVGNQHLTRCLHTDELLEVR
jgi:oligopeptide/dipeptide ABC transporter ATP-binding protein